MDDLDCVLPMNNPIPTKAKDDRSISKEAIVIKPSNIRIWIHDKDITKLTKVLWEGQGMRLRSETSSNPKVKKFLDVGVPHVTNLIKDIHSATVDNDLDFLKARTSPPVPRIVLSSKDSNGLTALHKAAGLAHIRLVEYLLTIWPQAAAEKDYLGRTPLHYAASAKNNDRCFNLLVQAGSDETSMDSRLKTAAFYKNRPHDIDRSLLTVIPEAPRIPQPGIPTEFDWSVIGEENSKEFINSNNNKSKSSYYGSENNILAKSPPQSINNNINNTLLKSNPNSYDKLKTLGSLSARSMQDNLDNTSEPELINTIRTPDTVVKEAISPSSFIDNNNEVDVERLIAKDNFDLTTEEEAVLAAIHHSKTSLYPRGIMNNRLVSPRPKEKLQNLTAANDVDDDDGNTISSPTKQINGNNYENNDENDVIEENQDEETPKEVDEEPPQEETEDEIKSDNKDDVELNDQAEMIEDNELVDDLNLYEDDFDDEINDTRSIKSRLSIADNIDIDENDEPEIDDNNNDDENNNIDDDENTKIDDEVENTTPTNDQELIENENDVVVEDVDEDKTEEEVGIIDNLLKNGEESGENSVVDENENNEEILNDNEENVNENEENLNEDDKETFTNTNIKDEKENENDIDKKEDSSQNFSTETPNKDTKNEDDDDKGKDDEDDEEEELKRIDNHNENDDEDENVESPSPALEIEGIVEGEPTENGQLQSQGANNLNEIEDARLQKIIDSGDMEQLASLVLNGMGASLVGMTSDQPEIQAFLDNVIAYMNKIRKVHLSAREGSLRDLQSALDRRKFAIAKDSVSPNGATPLHVATIFGHSGIVRYLAGRFPETTSAVDNNGRTALHYAATIHDNGHFYNLLVHLGANLNAKDNLGNTPEFYLNHSNSEKVFSHRKLLKDYGAEEEFAESMLNDQDLKIDQSHQQLEIPLFRTEEGRYLATSLGDPLIKGLTEVANKRPQDPIGYLANYLHTFASAKSTGDTNDNIEENNNNNNRSNFIQAQSNFRSNTNNSNTLIDNNIINNNNKNNYNNQQNDDFPNSPDGPETALTSEDRDEHGQSMLHFACARSHGRNGLIQLIEESGTSITFRDELYRTARDVSLQASQPDNAREIDRYVLSLAARGDVEAFQAMIIEGYDHILDVVDGEGNSIIEVAQARRNGDLVDFLNSIQDFEENRENLHSAIRSGNTQDVHNFAKRPDGGRLVRAKNYFGRNAIHIAALKENEEIVEFLATNFKQALRIGDNLERTPLHYAMGVISVEILSRILIKNGAKRVLKDLKGRQPSYYFMNKADIIRLQEEEEH